MIKIACTCSSRHGENYSTPPSINECNYHLLRSQNLTKSVYICIYTIKEQKNWRPPATDHLHLICSDFLSNGYQAETSLSDTVFRLVSWVVSLSLLQEEEALTHRKTACACPPQPPHIHTHYILPCLRSPPISACPTGRLSPS